MALLILFSLTLAAVSLTNAQDFNCPQPKGDFPDPRNQSMFYSCIDYIPTHIMCAEGTVFDTTIYRCNQQSYVDSLGGASCPDGDGMFPVYGSCGQYLVCSNGLPFVMNCPGSLLYNRTHNYCDRADRVSCS